jgi:alpha-acetolactate decarboxylase
MIRVVANKRLELSKEEFEYLQKLQTEFGEDIFQDLFQVNSDARIVSVTPAINKPVAMVILFFLLNLMLNQRLRNFEETFSKLDNIIERVKKLEDKNE